MPAARAAARRASPRKATARVRRLTPTRPALRLGQRQLEHRQRSPLRAAQGKVTAVSRRRPAARRRGRVRGGGARRAGRSSRPGCCGALRRRVARPESTTAIRKRPSRSRAATTIVGPPCSIALTIRLSSAWASALRSPLTGTSPAFQRSSSEPSASSCSRLPASRRPSGRGRRRRSSLSAGASGPPLISRSRRSSAARGKLNRLPVSGRAAEPRAGRQGHRLQWPAQLVQRLVEGAAAPAGAQALRRDRGRHRKDERPAGDDLDQAVHPSIRR